MVIYPGGRTTRQSDFNHLRFSFIHKSQQAGFFVSENRHLVIHHGDEQSDNQISSIYVLVLSTLTRNQYFVKEIPHLQRNPQSGHPSWRTKNQTMTFRVSTF